MIELPTLDHERWELGCFDAVLLTGNLTSRWHRPTGIGLA